MHKVLAHAVLASAGLFDACSGSHWPEPPTAPYSSNTQRRRPVQVPMVPASGSQPSRRRWKPKYDAIPLQGSWSSSRWYIDVQPYAPPDIDNTEFGSLDAPFSHSRHHALDKRYQAKTSTLPNREADRGSMTLGSMELDIVGLDCMEPDTEDCNCPCSFVQRRYDPWPEGGYPWRQSNARHSTAAQLLYSTPPYGLHDLNSCWAYI
ncbi:hypothetical protein B0T11DRAFT_344059 [Plectosphaerella cucumerina]|uniref:Uncharacterized protein n=1 Tax=Plectosphaerella cucumerina TaxID=40658 RepID=A0A8K0TPT2_9PEZI|nr:hypothetical protein B0T11DRAFT_344059 [Plectosphaerella cucumerina]